MPLEEYEDSSLRGITYREYKSRRAQRESVPLVVQQVEDEPHFIQHRSILDLSQNTDGRYFIVEQ